MNLWTLHLNLTLCSDSALHWVGLVSNLLCFFIAGMKCMSDSVSQLTLNHNTHNWCRACMWLYRLPFTHQHDDSSSSVFLCVLHLIIHWAVAFWYQCDPSLIWRVRNCQALAPAPVFPLQPCDETPHHGLGTVVAELSHPSDLRSVVSIFIFGSVRYV